MNGFVAMLILPLAVLAIGAYTAFITGEPMWLVFGAVLAIAMGYFARRILGS